MSRWGHTDDQKAILAALRDGKRIREIIVRRSGSRTLRYAFDDERPINACSLTGLVQRGVISADFRLRGEAS